MSVALPTTPAVAVHPAWLPDEAFAEVGARAVLLVGEGGPVETVAAELTQACAGFGGSLTRARHGADSAAAGRGAELVLALDPTAGGGDEGFTLDRRSGVTTLRSAGAAGLLFGFFHLVRLGARAFDAEPAEPAEQVHRPAISRRMLDHWDNVDVCPVMGQVERGYAGGSLLWDAGRLTADLDRVRRYARLLASIGINAVTVNNVNVHRTETELLTRRLDDVRALADVFRPYAIRVHLAVNFAAPLALGDLDTADPLDPAVREWWARATATVYDRIPDFGGYLVKADSEGQPGPFGYGRDHADGANLLAEAVAPHGGVVHWRAFVYNHHQDWRDRTTDRARAAHDHFAPLDGRFHPAVILQVKHGPMDFQVREPVSPVIGAMPNTRVAVELQVTQEYTGQQRHICYLAPMWSQVLGFRFWGAQGPTVAGLAAGERGVPGGGGVAAVSNAGADPFWTGHPLAQANLYAYGRLAWHPDADPDDLLAEWIDLTFLRRGPQRPELVRGVLRELMAGSWQTYEKYTAPLGVGFMVNPAGHYGPGVDGYEYSRWGTYHFADRDGVGVDRSPSGTGFTLQYPPGWAATYGSPESCPDELALFFHHLPYGHVLHSGRTVVQHIYDTHFEGAAQAAAMAQRWADPELQRQLDPALYRRVSELLVEQVRCAEEWRDQVNAYFFRKSGIPDAQGRRIP